MICAECGNDEAAEGLDVCTECAEQLTEAGTPPVPLE